MGACQCRGASACGFQLELSSLTQVSNLQALAEAYQRHEITRETRSLLFCVQALIDALDLGESLKTYGLHLKMTHDDSRLYLIGHASLEKRGLSIGQANIYQMLAPEHRLYLPFSLPQLLVDVNGKALPKPRSISARPPTLQELVDHLTALTTNSLPLALAHTTLHGGSDQGLGLLSPGLPSIRCHHSSGGTSLAPGMPSCD